MNPTEYTHLLATTRELDGIRGPSCDTAHAPAPGGVMAIVAPLHQPAPPHALPARHVAPRAVPERRARFTWGDVGAFVAAVAFVVAFAVIADAVLRAGGPA